MNKSFFSRGEFNYAPSLVRLPSTQWLLFIGLLLSVRIMAQSQEKNQAKPPIYRISRTQEAIEIDGKLEETTWKTADVTSPFLNQWPLSEGEAEVKTEVRLSYDDDFLYVAAKTFQPKEKVVLLSLKRDNVQANWQSDTFLTLLDPVNRKASGFMFGVNSGNAQYEAALSAQGEGTVGDANWDNKWFSATRVYDDHWTAELAIPFKTLRFQEENTVWGLNFVRVDMERNHFSNWSKVPINFDSENLGFFGKLYFDEAPENKSTNISLVPYLAGRAFQNFEANEQKTISWEGDIGFDAKVALSPALNLDLTVNPDFSNVDVDQQVLNLTRFDVFFPERRNFFLENSDLFTSFGTGDIIPFFSRKIGLEDGSPIPILAGARFTGNLTDALRIGVMDVQTRKIDGKQPNNYFVGAVQQRVFSRSSLKALITNRQSTQNNSENPGNYKRTAGTEVEYLSTNGELTLSGRFHRAFSNAALEDANFYGGFIGYNNGKIFGSASIHSVGRDFEVDMGFIPRLYHFNAETEETERFGFWQSNALIGYVFRPKEGSKFNQQSVTLSSFLANALGVGVMERNFNLRYEAYMASTASFSVQATASEQHLLTPSFLINGEIPLPVGKYSYEEVGISYTSDVRKTISGSINLTYGSFYTGEKLTFGNELNIRFRPWGLFGFSYLQNCVDLGEDYGSETLHLFGPKAEVNLSSTLFWTTFLQYNTQANNVNINSRFQWRYQPMCDFFLVYTDNYTDTFTNKNRGLVFKLTYWLSL